MDYNNEIDFSSLDTWLTCPRKFLFRYVMHLRPDGPPSLDLIFGSCWHYGMECAFKELQSSPESEPLTLVDLAINGFNTLWEKEASQWFDPDTCFPKNPGRAADMFYRFFTEWEHFYRGGDTRILGVEQPFTINLNSLNPATSTHHYPNYIGRLDLVVERDKKTVEIIDHKTAKFVNDTAMQGHTMSLQTDGYLTAGHLYYDSLPMIIYNIALCQKTKIDFTQHKVARRTAAIDRFLGDLIAHTTAIRNDLTIYQDELATQRRSPDKLYNPRCFRRKPGYACTLYFRPCEFYDLCLTRNNPLLWTDDLPQGYRREEWHPDNVDPKKKLEATDAS
jgi:hypothetical protein